MIISLAQGNPGAKPTEGTEAVFDRLASEYDAWFDESEKTIFATEIQAFRSISSPLPRPWLEVGVGSGRFAQNLGVEIGLDPSIKLLELARRRGIEVLLSKGEQVPFQDNVFGAVFLIATLCFIDSPVSILRECRRLIKRDGKVVLGLVLRESPWGQLYEAKKREGHRFYKHANFYSFDETRAFLGQADFAIQEVWSTLFQKPGEVKSIELPLKGISCDAGFLVIVAGRVHAEVEESR